MNRQISLTVFDMDVYCLNKCILTLTLINIKLTALFVTEDPLRNFHLAPSRLEGCSHSSRRTAMQTGHMTRDRGDSGTPVTT